MLEGGKKRSLTPSTAYRVLEVVPEYRMRDSMMDMVANAKLSVEAKLRHEVKDCLDCTFCKIRVEEQKDFASMNTHVLGVAKCDSKACVKDHRFMPDGRLRGAKADLIIVDEVADVSSHIMDALSYVTAPDGPYHHVSPFVTDVMKSSLKTPSTFMLNKESGDMVVLKEHNDLPSSSTAGSW